LLENSRLVEDVTAISLIFNQCFNPPLLLKGEVPSANMKKRKFQFCYRNLIGLLRMRSSYILEVPVNHSWRKG